jgi:hypothetical protein
MSLATYPYNHYWLADDGRVYFSDTQATLSDTDADYVAWTDNGNIATAWPRDDAGNQTNESLQAVVGPFGMSVAAQRK